MSLRRRSRLLLALAALVSAAACSDPPVSTPPTDPSSRSSAPRPTPTRATQPTSRPTASPSPAARMPIALVVHATRNVEDATPAQARRAAYGRATRWSQVGQRGGRMRVVRVDATTTPRQVIETVRAGDDVLGVLTADAVDATVRVLTVDGRHPLRDPARYPLTVPFDKAPPEVTTLAAVGDIMLGRRVGERMAAEDDWTGPFRPMARRLRSAEITIGNFESTLSTDGSPTQGGDSFAARRRALAGLKLAGFDLVSLANNHLGDYGQRAMRQTFDRFEGTGVATVGAGRNSAEARLPAIVVRNDEKIGFLAVDSIGETPAATSDRAGTNRLNMPPRTGPLDRRALTRITDDIGDLAKNVDVVIVLTHWGTQYTHMPEESQRIAARAFAKAGADLVIGGHPHWVQGWQLVGTTPVVHSLGNFIFDMDFQTKTREGIALEIVFWGGRLKAIEPVPYVIGDDFAPRVVTGKRAEAILDDVWSTSRGPYGS